MDYKKCTDDELVTACRKQARQAQQELFMRFSYMVKGICLRYSYCEDDADDLLQETFIRVFTKLDQYDDRGMLGAWIRKIAVNTALEYYRKNQSQKQQLVKTMDLHVLQPAVSDDIIEHLSAEALLHKIQQLPPGFRTVFNLYAIEGYNHSEIGGLLGISEGTSKSQYSRARLILRNLIEKEQETEHKLLHDAK